MTVLRIAPENGPPYDFDLPDGRAVFGRSSKSTVVLTDRFLSREHSEVFHESGRLWVRDLGSRNGTRVNGRLIEEPTALAAGDRIEISATTITVGDETGAAVPAASPSPALDPLAGTVLLSATDLAASFVAPSGPQADRVDLERQSARLRLLNEVHRALAESIELADLLELILDRAFDQLGPQQGSIHLKNEQGEWTRVAARKNDQAEEHLVSATLIAEVAEKGNAALVLDTATDERFGAAASILASGVRSLIAAPLLCPEGSLGMIALNSTLAKRQFEQTDLELLSSLASVAALRIWSLSLAEEAAERRRLEAELSLARRIQTALLPEALPEVPGYDLEALNVPSRGVSGDLYQVLTRADEAECVVFLADVSGKGMAASLLTATIEALAAVPIREGLPPAEILTLLGRLLEERTPAERFATAFLAVLEPGGGRLVYANAGHNPAVLVRRDGAVEHLERTGIPLGLLPEASYEEKTVELGPGDGVVVYTDGITEAANPDEEEYGLERLEAVCREHRGPRLTETVAAVETDLARFIRGEPFADDRTLVLLRRQDDAD